MPSHTPEPMPNGSTNQGVSPSSPQDQSSYMAPDAFNSGDSDFDNALPDLDQLQQLFCSPDDSEAAGNLQAHGATEDVKSEAGDGDSLAPLESIDPELMDVRANMKEENYEFEMQEPNEAALETPPALGESGSPEVTPSTHHSPRQSVPNRPLNFGSSILERQRAKQRELAARYFQSRTSPPPSAASPRQDSMEPPDNMPPPVFSRLSNAELEAEYNEAKATHARKRKARTLTTEQDIEFMKLQACFDARRRKFAVDQSIDQEPSPDPDSESGLFVSDVHSEVQYTSYSQLHSDDEDEQAIPQSARTRKRKAVDYAEDNTTTATPTVPRKPAKSRQKTSKDASTDADVDNRTKGKKDKVAAKTGGRGKQPTMTNVESVFHTNVFKDTEQNRDLPDQPAFQGTKRKADALKQLIASVPAENRKIATTDKRFLDEACKAFDGTGSVKAGPDGNWLVKGMRSSLKHYQILGAAFMRKRESELHEPRGGILADEMGLGKTVMMLANIVNGKPERGKPNCTLIVASPALCNQWDCEIRKHTLSKTQDSPVEHAKKHGIGRVVQHRANHRISTDNNRVRETIEEADICLTTYSEISRSYPKPIVPTHLTTAAQKDEWWKEYFEREKGIFHRIKFHRVVLDEAQAIKNHMGHTSLACRAVQGTHYWAITGTPIMNRLTEFYPYFKFLREPHTGSFKVFKENFCTPNDPDGTARLAVFLRKIMIRRTHLDTLFGARLLDLPRPSQTVVWLSFNETERQIYEIVKSRFIQRINTIAKKDNGVGNHYNHIWTMILRLRQLCAHILLVQGTIVDLLKREDFEKLNALCQRSISEDEGASILIHLRHVLETSVAANEDTVEAGAGGIGAVIGASETAPINAVDFSNHADNLAGKKHGLSFNFGKYMKALAESSQFEAIEDRSTCSACRQPPDQPQVTSCYHIYCLGCVNDLQHAAARNGRECANCVECGTEYTSVAPCALNPEYRTSTIAPASNIQSFDGNGKGAKGKGKKKKDEMNDWIGLKGEILPSTKTIACKAQILEWLQKDKHCKIIIYTQFMPIIRIMQKVCQTELWTHVVYQGSMSQDARDKAIKRFDENIECNIMLMSLRCGGLGLNLTMAQHVILIDPWWNSAVEQQAFCRVFRIGQTRETRMTRFVVENTIDAAMMAMKERKEAEIDEVMENPRLKEKLSVDELLRMFGEVRHDKGGRPFIFAEGDNEDHMRHREDDGENEDPLVNEF